MENKLTVAMLREMKKQLVGHDRETLSAEQAENLKLREYTTFKFSDEDAKKLISYDQPACTIHIFADLGRPAHPYVKGPYPGSNVYEIHVPAKEEDMGENLSGRHSLLAAWLHEIGHVIACVFGLPAAMRDPRAISRFPAVMSVHSDIDERIFAAEREAWDLADLIIGYDRTRNKALRSYQDRMNVIRYVPDSKDR